MANLEMKLNILIRFSIYLCLLSTILTSINASEIVGKSESSELLKEIPLAVVPSEEPKANTAGKNESTSTTLNPLLRARRKDRRNSNNYPRSRYISSYNRLSEDSCPNVAATCPDCINVAMQLPTDICSYPIVLKVLLLSTPSTDADGRVCGKLGLLSAFGSTDVKHFRRLLRFSLDASCECSLKPSHQYILVSKQQSFRKSGPLYSKISLSHEAILLPIDRFTEPEILKHLQICISKPVFKSVSSIIYEKEEEEQLQPRSYFNTPPLPSVYARPVYPLPAPPPPAAYAPPSIFLHHHAPEGNKDIYHIHDKEPQPYVAPPNPPPPTSPAPYQPSLFRPIFTNCLMQESCPQCYKLEDGFLDEKYCLSSFAYLALVQFPDRSQTQYAYGNPSNSASCLSLRTNVLYDVSRGADMQLLNLVLSLFLPANCPCFQDIKGFGVAIIMGYYTNPPADRSNTQLTRDFTIMFLPAPSQMKIPDCSALYSPKPIVAPTYPDQLYPSPYCSSNVEDSCPRCSHAFDSTQYCAARHAFIAELQNVGPYTLPKINPPAVEINTTEVNYYKSTTIKVKKTTPLTCVGGTLKIKLPHYDGDIILRYEVLSDCVCSLLSSAPGSKLLIYTMKDLSLTQDRTIQLTKDVYIFPLQSYDTDLPLCTNYVPPAPPSIIESHSKYDPSAPTYSVLPPTSAPTYQSSPAPKYNPSPPSSGYQPPPASEYIPPSPPLEYKPVQPPFPEYKPVQPLFTEYTPPPTPEYYPPPASGYNVPPASEYIPPPPPPEYKPVQPPFPEYIPSPTSVYNPSPASGYNPPPTPGYNIPPAPGYNPPPAPVYPAVSSADHVKLTTAPDLYEACPQIDYSCVNCATNLPPGFQDTYCTAEFAIIVAIGIDYDQCSECYNQYDPRELRFKPSSPSHLDLFYDEIKYTYNSRVSNNRASTFGQKYAAAAEYVCNKHKMKMLYVVTKNTPPVEKILDIDVYVPSRCPDCPVFPMSPIYGIILSKVVPKYLTPLQLSNQFSFYPLPKGKTIFPNCAQAAYPQPPEAYNPPGSYEPPSYLNPAYGQPRAYEQPAYEQPAYGPPPSPIAYANLSSKFSVPLELPSMQVKCDYPPACSMGTCFTHNPTIEIGCHHKFAAIVEIVQSPVTPRSGQNIKLEYSANGYNMQSIKIEITDPPVPNHYGSPQEPVQNYYEGPKDASLCMSVKVKVVKDISNYQTLPPGTLLTVIAAASCNCHFFTVGTGFGLIAAPDYPKGGTIYAEPAQISCLMASSQEIKVLGCSLEANLPSNNTLSQSPPYIQTAPSHVTPPAEQSYALSSPPSYVTPPTSATYYPLAPVPTPHAPYAPPSLLEPYPPPPLPAPYAPPPSPAPYAQPPPPGPYAPPPLLPNPPAHYVPLPSSPTPQTPHAAPPPKAPYVPPPPSLATPSYYAPPSPPPYAAPPSKAPYVPPHPSLATPLYYAPPPYAALPPKAPYVPPPPSLATPSYYAPPSPPPYAASPSKAPYVPPPPPLTTPSYYAPPSSPPYAAPPSKALASSSPAPYVPPPPSPTTPSYYVPPSPTSQAPYGLPPYASPAPYMPPIYAPPPSLSYSTNKDAKSQIMEAPFLTENIPCNTRNECPICGSTEDITEEVYCRSSNVFLIRMGRENQIMEEKGCIRGTTSTLYEVSAHKNANKAMLLIGFSIPSHCECHPLEYQGFALMMFQNLRPLTNILISDGEIHFYTIRAGKLVLPLCTSLSAQFYPRITRDDKMAVEVDSVDNELTRIYRLEQNLKPCPTQEVTCPRCDVPEEEMESIVCSSFAKYKIISNKGSPIGEKKRREFPRVSVSQRPENNYAVDIMISSDPPENVCTLEVDPGKCNSNITRLFYNKDIELCQNFEYSGCGGNRNNFETLDDCLQTCQGENYCYEAAFKLIEVSSQLDERNYKYIIKEGCPCEALNDRGSIYLVTNSTEFESNHTLVLNNEMFIISSEEDLNSTCNNVSTPSLYDKDGDNDDKKNYDKNCDKTDDDECPEKFDETEEEMIKKTEKYDKDSNGNEENNDKHDDEEVNENDGIIETYEKGGIIKTGKNNTEIEGDKSGNSGKNKVIAENEENKQEDEYENTDDSNNENDPESYENAENENLDKQMIQTKKAQAKKPFSWF